MTHRTDRPQHSRERDDLTGEHTVGDAGQLILALLFAAAWLLDTIFGWTTFPGGLVSPYIRIPLAIIVLALAAVLAWRGMSIVFGERRETPQVITKSVFSVVRHPIYLSEILLYFGFILFNPSLIATLSG